MMFELGPLLLALPLLGGSEQTMSVVRLEKPGTRLALGDVDGDGDADLCCPHDAGIDVHLQLEAGRFSPTPDATFDWPSEDLAWSLVDMDGDGTIELAGFVGAREVRVWSLDPHGEAASLGEGRLEVAARGQLPRGRFPMNFLRDVNGDGEADLVLPEFGRFAVYLRQSGASVESGESRWSAPLAVKLEAEVSYEVGDPDRLDAHFGQEVDIPWFSLRDVDGDGDRDLVAETEDSVSFHLAEPNIPDEPSWTLDLEALRTELPPAKDTDFDDLLSNLDGQVAWSLEDLDGQASTDLLIQVGAKFRVYLSGSRSGPVGVPDQVLKASGNVLGYMLSDVLDDELPELVIFRGERISLARVLRWLVLPGGLTFDLFTYRNDQGTFSTRPTKRNALELRFPRLLALMEELEEVKEALDEAVPVPAERIALDADGVADDVADIRSGELVLYHDVLPVVEQATAGDDSLIGILDASLLEELDHLPDGETRTFHLDDLLTSQTTDGATWRQACAEREPDRRIPLAPALDEVRIHPLALGAGRDGGPSDVLVLGKDAEGTWVAQLLVRP